MVIGVDTLKREHGLIVLDEHGVGAVCTTSRIRYSPKIPGQAAGKAFIVVNDATEHVVSPDRTSAWDSGRWRWALLAQPLMRAAFVVECDIFGEHAVQMSLVHDEQLIETLLPS